MVRYIKYSDTDLTGMLNGDVQVRVVGTGEKQGEDSHVMVRGIMRPCESSLHRDEVHCMEWRLRKRKLIWETHSCSFLYHELGSQSEINFLKTTSKSSYPNMVFKCVPGLVEE